MLFPSSTKRERWVVTHLFVNDELNSYICFSKFSLESLDLMNSFVFFFISAVASIETLHFSRKLCGTHSE